jgi:hypothetical protein
MTFGAKLDKLRDPQAFPKLGLVEKRWGQLLREQPELSQAFEDLTDSGNLVPLSSLARVHSGVVTRANAYFIVRELPLSGVPRRFNLTRNDYQRVAVVLDGVDTPFRIERDFLKPLIKGPDDLISPSRIRETDLRLFDVRLSREELKEQGANGALAYLRRGETFDYRTSGDDLKGGIPALRAQVKNRKPFWYSLGVPERRGTSTIVVPEHYDKRYIATLVPATNDSVINDTLYSIVPDNPAHAKLILFSLNSLLAWYQIELRGRTQHGQGLLKVKIPDFQGLQILNPDRVDPALAKGLNALFAKASSLEGDSLSTLGESSRIDFDEAILRAAGFTAPEEVRAELETELRGAVAERRERRLSVVDAKLDRRKSRGNAGLDALATRIAAGCEMFPDPRDFVGPGVATDTVTTLSAVEGPLRVGTELFNQNEVFAGDTCVARLEDGLSAHFVRGVLLHDPTLTKVEVPAKWARESIVNAWETACRLWRARLDATAATALRSVSDPRTRREAIAKALSLLHAE